MRTIIIANPAARKGAARLLIPKVEQRLRQYGLDFDLVYTGRPWHAATLAQEAATNGYDQVVAAGGDGTFNEVLNGLMLAQRNSPKKPAVGMLCIGRGNDFAFGAGIPTDWEQGCKALASGQRRAIDIGRVTGDWQESGDNGNCERNDDHGSPRSERFFGNGVGIGFDALVNIQATKMRIGGFAGYTIGALRTILLHFKSPLMRIECDDETITQPSIMVSIMNGRRMGGGFHMTPNSLPDDGALDLCIARQVSRATILMMIPRFMQGTQGTHPAIRFVRTRRVVVTALSDTLPFHVDGESICTSARQITIEAFPSAVEVLCGT